ncbi:phage tail tape measure protein [Variovorax boronicumulans]|uniref:phage tail tape measure protein n=1 Tax=Variovorax boronicumulans TaxID=436515 RepID=UPI0027845BB6|nr:phage tail tape measure protein [Variovorax boronicumulans]MDQ0040816.1 lambda family phage tail tape measure protein [Variovorax boronicumulans]
MTDLTAKMVFTADASGVVAGVAVGKRSLADLGVTAVTEGKKAAEGVAAVGKGGDQAAAKLDAATRNMVASIQRTTAAAEAGKKSGSEYFAALANQRGIPADVLKPYLAQLDSALAKQKAAEAALNATAPAIDRVGMSAKATAAALRGVPAQFTDIITSIQGGQAPLTVLLQQGGQLKDMFGGIGPAARALGGYVLGLVNPFTLAAAAAGLLALAFYKGEQQTAAYNKALILTGNYAGTTASQLQDQAAEITNMGGTNAVAAESVAKLAASGKIASESIVSVGAAVSGMNRVLGTSIDEAVSTFTKLADEPTKASEKLNETMHHLTATTLERIRTLEEQGRKEEAAALAVSSAAGITNQRLAEVKETAGVLARAWRLMGDDAKKAWDLMMGIGRPKTASEALSDARTVLSELQARGPIGGPVTGKSDFEVQMRNASTNVALASVKELQERLRGFSQGVVARDETAAVNALGDVAKWQDKAKGIDAVSRELKKYRDNLEDLRKRSPDSALLDPKNVAAGEAAIRREFGGPKGAKEKAFQDDAGDKMLQALKQTEASLQSQLDGELKITEVQKKQVEFQQLIADLKGKKILTADQQSLLADRERISAQLEKNVGLSNQIEFEKKIAEITKKSAEDAKQYRQQVDAINLSIGSGQDSRNEQSARSLDVLGRGDRARQEVEAQRSIRNEFQRYINATNKTAGENGQLGSAKYQEDVERIKKALDDALTAQTAYFDALKSKQADWQTGATTALANYADAIANVSATTEKAFTDGFRGAEDALVKFVTTGKGGVKGLADSIIADLVRVGIQRTITGPIANGLLGALGGDEIGDLLKKNGNFGTSLAGSSGGGLGEILGSIGKWFGGFFADGGKPPVGLPSIVGERGPEVFIPSVPGSIVPNHALGGGGGTTVIYQMTVGDVASKSMVLEAVQTAQRQTAARFSRSRAYGGQE